MIYTDIELSKVLKVNRSSIYRWRTECAMPVDDLEAARAFAETRKPAIKRIPKVEVDPIPRNTPDGRKALCEKITHFLVLQPFYQSALARIMGTGRSPPPDTR